MVDSLYRELKKSFESYITDPEALNSIFDAYIFARDNHKGQVRKSGEPYITHPVAVTKILADLGSGPSTLIASLLHDVVEDTDITLEDVKNRFGNDISQLVDSVTKLSKLNFKDGNMQANQADNHQKMLLAMAKDIRVILIKIADRLHNMRTLDVMIDEKRVRIAKETLEIYAPLAHRLGIFKIKAELEDRALQYTDPDKYFEVSHLVKLRLDESQGAINVIINEMDKLFASNNVETFSIKGRIKNIYSIYKKMYQNNRAFEDIYDLLAVRIIVDKVEECYQVLGLIHANYTPIPRRFKDYIAVPKPNLYQSLHTTVLSIDGTLFEVQIRTQEMDKVAEYGVAAHWAYKENKLYSREREQFEIASKLKWYGDLLKMSEDQDEKESGSEEFVNTIKEDILTANVYVFTPKGEVIELNKGATPIDFAYRIHTDVGHKMSGALVNNRIVPLDYTLKTGDIVSVKTNKNSNGPSSSWLKIVKSSHARNKIKGFLNKQNKESLIISGEESLKSEFTHQKIHFNIDDEFVKKHFNKNLIETISELYHEVGKGNISPKTVATKALGRSIDKEEFIKKQLEKSTKQLESISQTGIIVEGLTNPQISLGNCCHPIPGDAIIGYVSKNGGLIVHYDKCPNVLTLNKERLIDVYWASEIKRNYSALLLVKAETKPNILADVVTAVNQLSISIAEIKTRQFGNNETAFKIKVLVSNKEQLAQAMTNLLKVPEIYEVVRDFQ